jgi:hypothetical protein
MTIVIGLILAVLGMADVWFVSAWWLRQRRRQSYDWPDRNIFIALTGLGLIAILAAVRLVT